MFGHAGCKSPPAYLSRFINMDRDYLAKLCDARDTLCGFCKSGGCLQCRVRHIIDDVFSELSEEDEDA